jgi:hypothetical protein
VNGSDAKASDPFSFLRHSCATHGVALPSSRPLTACGGALPVARCVGQVGCLRRCAAVPVAQCEVISSNARPGSRSRRRRAMPSWPHSFLTRKSAGPLAR